jgi:hypothetical protein
MSKAKEIPGLHIQWPWSQLILSGKKTVETRGYPLPKKYIGQSLAIIETPGRNGAAAGLKKSHIVGVIKFSESFQYQSKAQWKNDAVHHLVQEDDRQFAFSPDKVKWGWIVAEVKKLPQPLPPPRKRGIIFASACKI